MAAILQTTFSDAFSWMKINEFWPFKSSLKFVPYGPINNIPALVQIMAWCPPGHTPLSEPVMVRLPMHICVTRSQRIKLMQLCYTLSKCIVNVMYNTKRCVVMLFHTLNVPVRLGCGIASRIYNGHKSYHQRCTSAKWPKTISSHIVRYTVIRHEICIVKSAIISTIFYKDICGRQSRWRVR